MDWCGEARLSWGIDSWGFRCGFLGWAGSWGLEIGGGGGEMRYWNWGGCVMMFRWRVWKVGGSGGEVYR